MSRPVMATHIEGVYQSTRDHFHTVSEQGQLSAPKTFALALEETLAHEQDQLDGIILFLEEELEQYNDFLFNLNGWTTRGLGDDEGLSFADWQSRQVRYQDSFLALLEAL